jgi:competence protein ComEA
MPEVTATGSATGGGSGDAKVSVNAGDTAALQTLPGVGPVTAAAIIAYRTEHGPFTDLAQLQEVSGIGPATFARLEPHVTL